MKRTPLELWLIVESNFKNMSISLCSLFAFLWIRDIITYEEYNLLRKEVKAYKESRYGILKFPKTFPFLWEPHEKKPRRKFVQKQILKHLKN